MTVHGPRHMVLTDQFAFAAGDDTAVAGLPFYPVRAARSPWLRMRCTGERA